MTTYNSLREKIAAEKQERMQRYEEFERIVEQAHHAGMQAGVECRPVAYHVMQGNKIVGHLDDGACGFAWVNVKPANSSFALWAKKSERARKSYYGGIDFWVSEFGQSVDRKASYAEAFAKVLRDHGIKAYSNSRLD